MSERRELVKSIEGIAYAYLILHLDITFFGLNILPNWLGYIAIVHVLDVISEEEPSAWLLRPLGILMIVWELLCSVLGFAGVTWSSRGIDALAAVIGLYFHFQLLTNLAAIAEKYDSPSKEKLLRLRTVRTIVMTVLSLPVHWEAYQVLSVVIIAVGLIVGFWTCIELFALKKFLEPQEDAVQEEEKTED